MNEEILEVLRAIKGELVLLRNDFLMLRVAVEEIEKEIKHPKEKSNLNNFFGKNTQIEKL